MTINPGPDSMKSADVVALTDGWPRKKRKLIRK